MLRVGEIIFRHFEDTYRIIMHMSSLIAILYTNTILHSACVFRTSVVLFTPSIDVFLRLNGAVIPNNGLLYISDIGSSDNTALLCITNLPLPSGSTHSGGDWFAPNGYRVGDMVPVPGFNRNRGPMVVRLFRKRSETPTEGIYYCSIEDSTFTLTTVNVGLYNSEGGKNK